MVARFLQLQLTRSLLPADNQERLSRWLTVQSAVLVGHNVTPVLNQSASSLGWTCGNLVAPPLEVARFFWDLLGPQPRIVSRETLRAMMPDREFTNHWHVGSPNYRYGSGLLWFMPPLSCSTPVCAYTGHGGDTWGFVSANGFFEAIGVSMSLAMASHDVALLDQLASNFSRTIFAALPQIDREAAHARVVAVGAWLLGAGVAGGLLAGGGGAWLVRRRRTPDPDAEPPWGDHPYARVAGADAAAARRRPSQAAVQ